MSITMATDTFSNWLQAELDERGMTPAELSRAAGIGKGSLSDIFSGRRKVGTEMATAIADALRLPQEQVFRAAGLLRPKKNATATVEKIVHEVDDMSEEEQKEYLAYIRWANNQRKKKK